MQSDLTEQAEPAQIKERPKRISLIKFMRESRFYGKSASGENRKSSLPSAIIRERRKVSNRTRSKSEASDFIIDLNQLLEWGGGSSPMRKNDTFYEMSRTISETSAPDIEFQNMVQDVLEEAQQNHGDFSNMLQVNESTGKIDIEVWRRIFQLKREQDESKVDCHSDDDISDGDVDILTFLSNDSEDAANSEETNCQEPSTEERRLTSILSVSLGKFSKRIGLTKNLYSNITELLAAVKHIPSQFSEKSIDQNSQQETEERMFRSLISLLLNSEQACSCTSSATDPDCIVKFVHRLKSEYIGDVLNISVLDRSLQVLSITLGLLLDEMQDLNCVSVKSTKPVDFLTSICNCLVDAKSEIEVDSVELLLGSMLQIPVSLRSKDHSWLAKEVISQEIEEPHLLAYIVQLLTKVNDDEYCLACLNALNSLFCSRPYNCDVLLEIGGWESWLAAWMIAYPQMTTIELQERSLVVSSNILSLMLVRSMILPNSEKVFKSTLKKVFTSIVKNTSPSNDQSHLKRLLMYCMVYRCTYTTSSQIQECQLEFVRNQFELFKNIRSFLMFPKNQKTPLFVDYSGHLSDRLLVSVVLKLISDRDRKKFFTLLHSLSPEHLTHYQGKWRRYKKFFQHVGKYMDVVQNSDKYSDEVVKKCISGVTLGLTKNYWSPKTEITETNMLLRVKQARGYSLALLKFQQTFQPTVCKEHTSSILSNVVNRLLDRYGDFE